MTPAPNPTPVQAFTPDLACRFGLIVAGLAALVARRFLRDRNLQTLIIPLWTRLTRAATRFERLMARLATNRPTRPRPSRPHRPNTTRTTALPAGHGWLIRALPNEAAAYASQLDSLLAEPAVADLLAAHPAAGRIFRPLARMLGLSALAPKRNRPKRRPQTVSPCVARPRAPLPPLHPDDPSYRPSAHWPRGPWPAPRWPRATPA